MEIQEVKDKLKKEKEERYNTVLNYWKERKPFRDEDDIPPIPIVLPKDYGGIPKDKLIVDKTYIGGCRNATEAVWDGEKFTYMRTKFGSTYPETINHFQDDDGYDLFVPLKIKDEK